MIKKIPKTSDKIKSTQKLHLPSLLKYCTVENSTNLRYVIGQCSAIFSRFFA